MVIAQYQRNKEVKEKEEERKLINRLNFLQEEQKQMEKMANRILKGGNIDGDEEEDPVQAAFNR